MTSSKKPIKQLPAPEHVGRADIFPVVDPIAHLVDFDNKGNSQIFGFGTRAQLYIRSSSSIQIKTWARPTIQIQLSSIAPFDMYHRANRIWLNENKPSAPDTSPNFVTIHVPYHFGVLGLNLSGKAIVDSDAMPLLTNALVTGRAQAVVQTGNLFLQTADQAETKATMVCRKEDVYVLERNAGTQQIVETTPGEIFILAEGGVTDILGKYAGSNIVLKNGARIQHNAHSTELNTVTLDDGAFWEHPVSGEYPPPKLKLMVDIPFKESGRQRFVKDSLRLMMSKLGL